MELGQALEVAASERFGVLVTLKRDGRPQLSNVGYAIQGETVRVSVTADRAKTANARRDPRVSLYVGRQDHWAYLVLEGDAELSAIAAAPDDEVVDELVELYRAAAGEHPDWDDFRQAMVRDRRLVLRVDVTHAYGMWPRG